jgi:hypothetical protein
LSFGRVGIWSSCHLVKLVFGRVVVWSSWYLVELPFGRVGFGRPDLVELSFGRVVAHSSSVAPSLKPVNFAHSRNICYGLGITYARSYRQIRAQVSALSLLTHQSMPSELIKRTSHVTFPCSS